MEDLSGKEEEIIGPVDTVEQSDDVNESIIQETEEYDGVNDDTEALETSEVKYLIFDIDNCFYD